MAVRLSPDDLPGRETPSLTGESLDRWGPTAVMSYLALMTFAAGMAGVFWLIYSDIKIDGLMGALIGSVLTAAAQNSQGALGFWTGGNIGAKQASTALAKIASTPSISAPSATTQTINQPGPPADEYAIPEPPK